MSIHRSYAVFGLGRYGRAVAGELVRNGAEVLAVDINEAVVNAAVSEIPLCKCADVTDPEVIRQLGIGSMDVVIIAMAGQLEAEVMATVLCKEAGAGQVIVKCANEMHQKILSRVGADKVVIPEQEAGVRTAKNLLSAGFVDLVELSHDVGLVDLPVRPEWVGKTLRDLSLRKNHGLNVVAFREGEDVSVNIDPDRPLTKRMKLIVIANTHRLNKMI